MKLRSKTASSPRKKRRSSPHTKLPKPPSSSAAIRPAAKTRLDHKNQNNQQQQHLASLPSTSRGLLNFAAAPPPSLFAYSTRRSSTASGDFSPDSPGIGRVAKSNARLLNGLDLSAVKRGCSTSYVGTAVALPELKTFEIGERCPSLNKLLLKNGGGMDAARKLSIEQLSTIQFELEELCSQNVDYQSNIHGEITYLTTGEYPTVDLTKRPMPLYESVHKSELQKLKERTKRAAPTPTSMSLADLGILSSPEDDETPHILDVPQRFWTWSREYLRHISLDYMKEFRTKILERFSEEVIIGKYCQVEASQSSQSTTSLKQEQQTKNSTSKTNNNNIIPRGMTTKRRRHSLEQSTSDESSTASSSTEIKTKIKSRGPPVSKMPRFNTLPRQKSAANSAANPESSDLKEMLQKSPPTKSASSSSSYRSRATSFKFGSKLAKSSATISSEKITDAVDCNSPVRTPNGIHPRVFYYNGLNNKNKKTFSQLQETPKTSHTINSTSRRSSINKNNNSNSSSSRKIVVRSKNKNSGGELAQLSSGDEEEEEESDLEEETTRMNGGGGGGGAGFCGHEGDDEQSRTALTDNGAADACKTPSSSTSSTTNEVSAELLKKQQQLRELFQKTKPTIDLLHSRLLREYAVHEAFHKMDVADNLMYDVCAKLEKTNGRPLSRELRQEMQAAMREHNQVYKSLHSKI